MKDLTQKRAPIYLSVLLLATSFIYAFSPYKQTAPTTEQSRSRERSPATSLPRVAYADGTYSGIVTHTLYGGTIQTSVTIRGGKVADVQFLQYPGHSGTSRFINDRAIPILAQEAVRAQSADVDAVTGATFTTEAFWTALDSALIQARK